MKASAETLVVWVAGRLTGLLARENGPRHVFSYDPTTQGSDQVSLTMPVRLESWVNRDLHPVFQMNLPEGALLEAIRRTVAKLMGEDDLIILRVTGGNQIGRNRFSPVGDEAPGLPESPESLEELLTYPNTSELFHELMNRYFLRSGVSGVQPKVLLEATDRVSLTTAGYIVKSWGDDYPQLAANEFFCMSAAKQAGLPVPEFHLAENGGLFVMKRFDLGTGGVSLGFEDMCSLQGVGTSKKYSGSYERVARSICDFVSAEYQAAARQQYFQMMVLSLMVRNGDAHLKNFGVLYESASGPVRLAPVYDVVTTTAYIRKDLPALSLGGAKKWWSRKTMEQFAVTHLSLSSAAIRQAFERVADAVTETRGRVMAYISDHPEFRQTGEAMLEAWDSGVSQCSLKTGSQPNE
ncbi:MAG: type II toxin-antitoxin system HipA family toxin [Nitrospirota bacterium]|nr:type II toxin-antitoxin system HipA family toxin [Nitrospirota bacterium]